jgi:hypothetical protein
MQLTIQSMRSAAVVVLLAAVALLGMAIASPVTDPPPTREQGEGVPYEWQCTVCEELVRYLSEDVLLKKSSPGPSDMGGDGAPLTREEVTAFLDGSVRTFATAYRFSRDRGLEEWESINGDPALNHFVEHMRNDPPSLAALLAFRHAYDEAGQEFLDVAEAMVCQHSLNLCDTSFMPQDPQQASLMEAYFRAMDYTSGLFLDDL